MTIIPIHNETDYTLTDDMMQYIVRDAQEYFGEEVRAIRVQAGIERHALNARTHEVRYAFSPQDFGFGPTMPIAPEPRTPETPRSRRRPPQRDAETADERVPAPFEDDEEDEEDIEPIETSLESLDEGQDDEEEDVFTLDAPVEDMDEDNEDNVLEDDEENIFEDDEV